MATHNRIKQTEIDFIKESSLTIKEIAKILGRHHATIGKIARANSKKLKRGIGRKYGLNQDFFKNLNQESVYLLGFIMADGCVSLGPRNGGVVSFTLQARDIEILENIKKMVNTNCPIGTRVIKGKNYVRLNLCSKEMCDDLIKLGCIPNKTLRLEFPEIPLNLIPDFVRGYFDGDGHIKVIKKSDDFRHKNDYLRIQFTGRHEFITSLHSK